MIPCTENCKYQKNGICTYEEIKPLGQNSSLESSCIYYEQE